MRNQEGGGPPLRFTAARPVNNNNNSENNLTHNNTNGILRREVTRAGGFNFAGFRFRFGVVLTTHQRPQDPQQQREDNANAVSNSIEAPIIDNASSNIEENSESSFEEVEGAVGTTTAAVASDEDASTISKLEEVKEDLRQVSEALKPFVSKSDES